MFSYMSSKFLLFLFNLLLFLSCQDLTENKPNTLKERIEFADKIELKIPTDSAIIIYERILNDFRLDIDYKQEVYLHNKIAENTILSNLRLTKIHLDSALLASKKGESEPSELGSTYDDLGLYYEALEKFDSGQYYIQKGLDFRLEHLSQNDPQIANSYLSMAFHYGNVRQEFDKAFYYAEKALAIRLKSFGENHLLTGECYSNLAYYYSFIGDYEKALNYQKKSLEIITNQKSNQYSVLVNYGNIGELLEELGNFNEAKNFHLKIIASPRTAETELQIAAAYTCLAKISQMFSTDSSKYYFDQAKTIYERRLPKDHPIIGKFNLQIGEQLFSKSLYDSALYHYGITKEIYAKNANSDPVKYASIFLSLTELYLKKGMVEKAIETSENALKLLIIKSRITDENGVEKEIILKSNRINIYQALFLKGKALFKKGDINSLLSALGLFNQSIENIESLKKGYSNDLAREKLTIKTASIFDYAIQTSYKLYLKTGDKKYIEKAFGIAEKNRAFNLVIAVNDSKAKKFARISTELIDEEETIKRDLTFYRDKVYEATNKNDSVSLNIFQNKLFKTEVAHDRLLKKIAKVYPEYYELKNQIKTISSQEIRKNLQMDEALVEYYIGSAHLYIFLLTKDELKVFAIQKEKEFEKDIKSLYTSINKYQKENFFKYSRLLYAKLAEPFIEKLPESIKKLRIVPHNELTNISFDCLGVAKSKSGNKLRYLIEDFEISYHYSAKLVFNTCQSNPSLKNIGLFAPVFDGYNPDKLPPLPGSLVEINSISKLFGSVGLSSELTIRENATKKAFQEKINNKQIIHLATHTLIDREFEEKSRMYFSKKEGNNSNVLTLAETYNMKLNAQLLTLSSCESGIGKLVKGEGMLSFTRGFSYSGIKNINCSLWKVNDFYTAIIMRKFYREVVNGESFAAALRTAKLSVLNENSNSPKDWAGFILISN